MIAHYLPPDYPWYVEYLPHGMFALSVVMSVYLAIAIYRDPEFLLFFPLAVFVLVVIAVEKVVARVSDFGQKDQSENV